MFDKFKALLTQLRVIKPPTFYAQGTPHRRHKRIKPPATTIHQAMRRGGQKITITNPKRFLHASRSAK